MTAVGGRVVATRVTAAESEMQQRRVAAALAVRGVREGDRVAVIAANSPLVIAVALGALRVGVVPVMVNADLLAGEQQVILDDCRPALTLRGADVDAFIREETSEAVAPLSLFN